MLLPRSIIYLTMCIAFVLATNNADAIQQMDSWYAPSQTQVHRATVSSCHNAFKIAVSGDLILAALNKQQRRVSTRPPMMSRLLK